MDNEAIKKIFGAKLRGAEQAEPVRDEGDEQLQSPELSPDQPSELSVDKINYHERVKDLLRPSAEFTKILDEAIGEYEKNVELYERLAYYAVGALGPVLETIVRGLGKATISEKELRDILFGPVLEIAKGMLHYWTL